MSVLTSTAAITMFTKFEWRNDFLPHQETRKRRGRSRRGRDRAGISHHVRRAFREDYVVGVGVADPGVASYSGISCGAPCSSAWAAGAGALGSTTTLPRMNGCSTQK